MMARENERRRGTGWLLVALVGAVIGQLLGWNSTVDAQETPSPILVTWQTSDGGTFRTVVDDAVAIARITDAFAADGIAGVPIGTLLEGDGGVNAPHAWHLENVTIADMTIELCDGTPGMIDADLETWLTSVGSFCPWSARVIAVERVPDPTAPPGDPAPSPPPVYASPCADDPASDDPVVVTFETGDSGEGDTFQAVLTDPQSIARAESEVALGVDCGFPNGLLIAAQGELNAPHAWDLTDAVYTEIAIEACSARASEVDANLEYWLGYGRYCPWSAQAIAVEPLAAVPPTVPTPSPADIPLPDPSDGAAPMQPTAAAQPTVPDVTPLQPSGGSTASGPSSASKAPNQPVAALPNTGSGRAMAGVTVNAWWVIGSIGVACSLLLFGERRPARSTVRATSGGRRRSR